LRANNSQLRRPYPGDAEPASKLRADAHDNRQKIIAASRELFASRGPDVPMKAIARHAGVGMATLYRRFPTRLDLIADVFAEQLAECAAIVETAISDPDPWRGLCSVVTGLTAMQAADNGFNAAFIRQLPIASQVAHKLQGGMTGVEQMIERAQAAGQLRADFTFDDLTLILMANHGVTSQAGDATPAASQRLVAYLLDAFRTEVTARGELPPPATLSLPRLVLAERE
jgi:AcrR family transcriptional regulator